MSSNRKMTETWHVIEGLPLKKGTRSFAILLFLRSILIASFTLTPYSAGFALSYAAIRIILVIEYAQ
jgi:hypothetical protein